MVKINKNYYKYRDYILNFNELKNTIINSLDDLSFYVYLLNNHYNKFKEDDINKIKNNMILYILSKYNNSDNFSLIKYLNLIVIKSYKSYHIPEKKLIKLLDF